MRHFIYLFTSLHNQTTCSRNTHSRRCAGNSDIVTTNPWVQIYIGSEVVAYMTVEYLHGKQYNSVRLFIGQSVDVN